MASSERLLEARSSQFENVPFCTAVGATLSLVEKPVGSHSKLKAQMNKKLQDSCGKIGDAVLLINFFTRLSIPTYIDSSEQISLSEA